MKARYWPCLGVYRFRGGSTLSCRWIQARASATQCLQKSPFAPAGHDDLADEPAPHTRDALHASLDEVRASALERGAYRELRDHGLVEHIGERHSLAHRGVSAGRSSSPRASARAASRRYLAGSTLESLAVSSSV